MNYAPVLRYILLYNNAPNLPSQGRSLRSRFDDISECKIPKEMQLKTAYNTTGAARVQIGSELRVNGKEFVRFGEKPWILI
jgi:hypothetical protein